MSAASQRQDRRAAAGVVARALRHGLQPGLSWWSFTFPVGTCVTEASQLSLHTGLQRFTAVALALLTLLLVGWTTAAGHTGRQIADGHLAAPGPGVGVRAFTVSQGWSSPARGRSGGCTSYAVRRPPPCRSSWRSA